MQTTTKRNWHASLNHAEEITLILHTDITPGSHYLFKLDSKDDIDDLIESLVLARDSWPT